MRVTLNRHSKDSFCAALSESGIEHRTIPPKMGVVVNSLDWIEIVQAAKLPATASALFGAIATVMVSWLKARSSRKIILTLEDATIVHLEGYSVEQAKQLLPSVVWCSAIDTQPIESLKLPDKKPSK